MRKEIVKLKPFCVAVTNLREQNRAGGDWLRTPKVEKNGYIYGDSLLEAKLQYNLSRFVKKEMIQITCLDTDEWMCPRYLVLCPLPLLHPHTASVSTEFTRSGYDELKRNKNKQPKDRRYLIRWRCRPEYEPLREAPPIDRWLAGAIIGTRSHCQEEEWEKKTAMHRHCFCSHAVRSPWLIAGFPWQQRLYRGSPYAHSTGNNTGSCCVNYANIKCRHLGILVNFDSLCGKTQNNTVLLQMALPLLSRACSKKNTPISVKRFGS